MGDPSDPLETLPSLDTGDAALVEQGRARVLCATLLYHPDLSRVGERCLLLQPARGAPLAISRTDGDFCTPSGSSPRTLEDPYVSREPVTIRIPRGGGLELEVSDKHGARIDGAPVEGRIRFENDRLDVGVLFELSKRVLFLLHRVESGVRPASHGLIGESTAIRKVRRAIENVADLDVGVLLVGETGVGKDRVARAIHEARADAGPFVAVNMATVNRNTAASELFGHVKGAFTGADRAHDGLFVRADGGTLFLDEVGELAHDIQGMLLRVLETRSVRPLGGTGERPVEVRVIAATDANLEEMVEAGSFRSALFHRFGGYRIDVPPLRERKEDVPRLAVAFLREELARLDQADRLLPPPPGQRPWLHRRTMQRLYRHDWPGNVRQLRNVVRQLAISSRSSKTAVVGDQVEAVLGPTPTASHAGEVIEPAPSKEIGEAQLIEVLRRHRWMFGPAARELGLNRTTFYRLVEKHPSIRKGPDLTREELEAARDEGGGDLDRMSERLRVSRRAIGLRMAELGLHRG